MRDEEGFLGGLLRLDIQVIVGAVGVGGGHRPVKVALISSLLDGLPIEGVGAAAGIVNDKGGRPEGAWIYRRRYTVNRCQQNLSWCYPQTMCYCGSAGNGPCDPRVASASRWHRTKGIGSGFIVETYSRRWAYRCIGSTA